MSLQYGWFDNITKIPEKFSVYKILLYKNKFSLVLLKLFKQKIRSEGD